MAVKKSTAPYSLADILGTPLSEQEAVSLVSKTTSPDTFHNFNIMEESYRQKLLQFLMGKRGLSITYDTVFKYVMMPGGTTDRLEQFLTAILGEPIQIKQILPREGSQLADTSSFIIADIIVSTRDGSIMNVEIQKIGYNFPGERASCYTADMIMRQYNYLKSRNQNFTYRDMKPVYLIVFMEHSPALFKTTDQYIHKKCSYFNTDIKLNLLENIIFISLDTFHDLVQNINTTQDAWLEFLTEDNPEKIVRFVNQFPEFLPCYQDLISFRKKPEELIHMFSDALRELDKNTERYMVEELNKEVADLKEEATSLKKQAATLKKEATALKEETTTLKNETTTLKKETTMLKNETTMLKKELDKRANELNQQAENLQESGRQVATLQETVAEKDSTICRQNSELADMRALIQSLTQKLEEYEHQSEKAPSAP